MKQILPRNDYRNDYFRYNHVTHSSGHSGGCSTGKEGTRQYQDSQVCQGPQPRTLRARRAERKSGRRAEGAPPLLPHPFGVQGLRPEGLKDAAEIRGSVLGAERQRRNGPI